MSETDLRERIAALESRLAAQHHLIDGIPHMVWTTDHAGRPTYLNARVTAYSGVDLATAEARGAPSFIHPADLPRYVERATAGRAARAPFEITMRFRRADGVYRHHRCRFEPLAAGETSPWLATGTDVDEELRFEEQQEFLVEAGRRLGASLDSKQTLGDVAAILVPHLADWFAVDLAGEDGVLVRVAMAHADPSKVEAAWQFFRLMPPRPDDPGGIYAVVRTGEPEIHENIPDELLAQSIADPVVLALLRSLGLRSSMCVPLVAGERTVGALTLVAAESNRRYGQRDLAFATALAGRIAIAVENARLFELTQQARAASEALTADVIAQSEAARELVVSMRRERDDALAELERLRRR